MKVRYLRTTDGKCFSRRLDGNSQIVWFWILLTTSHWCNHKDNFALCVADIEMAKIFPDKFLGPHLSIATIFYLQWTSTLKKS